MNRNIVAFDVETTGLDHTTDHIIQLAAVKFDSEFLIPCCHPFVKKIDKINNLIYVELVDGLEWLDEDWYINFISWYVSRDI